jgi:hypothetical protein
VGGDYQQDAPFRQLFQSWMNSLWMQKDVRLGALLRKHMQTDGDAISEADKKATLDATAPFDSG